MKRKFLSWLLTLAMVLSLVPAVELPALAASSQTTLTLGNPIWTNNTKQKFTYPAATIESGETQFTMLSVTVSAGAVATAVGSDTAKFTDIAVGGKHQSATWYFESGKALADVQELLRKIEFTYAANMKVSVQVDANPTDFSAVDSISGKNLSYNPTTGHYYLYVPERISWSAAYNQAKQLKLVGMQGYLSTPRTTAEVEFYKKITNATTWTGGTMLVKSDGTPIRDDSSLTRSLGSLKIPDGFQIPGNESTATANRAKYYWACGPYAGTDMASAPWRTGTSIYRDHEPNSYVVPTGAGQSELNRPGNDLTIFNTQTYESCVMVIGNQNTLNDVWEGRISEHEGTTYGVSGYFVEFGGYAEGQDPGNPVASKSAKQTVTLNAANDPKPAEAQIGALKYATLADTLALAKTGETVEIIVDNPTSTGNVTLKDNVTLKTKTGVTYKADGDSTIKVSNTQGMTLYSGKVVMAGTSPRLEVDGYMVTGDCTVTAEDTNNNTADNAGRASITVAAGQSVTVQKDGKNYTYTATAANQTFYLGEYTAKLNGEDRSSATATPTNTGKTVHATLTKPSTPTPTNPYHQQTNYEVTITPNANYTIHSDNIGVMMDNGTGTYTALTKNTDYTIADAGNGAYKVTISKAITGNVEYLLGDIVDNSDPSNPTTTPTVSRDMVTITVSSSTYTVGADTYTATYTPDGSATPTTVSSNASGEVTVPKNTEVKLEFPAQGQTAMNATAGEKETFHILTGLTDLTGGGAGTELFTAQNMKTTFQWSDKSYSYTFTPSVNTPLTATYTKAHVVHIHLSGGTMTDPTGYIEKREDTPPNARYIVADNGKLTNLSFTADGSITTPSFSATWSKPDASETVDIVTNTTPATNTITGSGANYSGTTPDVTEPRYLNVSFVDGQIVTVNVVNGDLTSAEDWDTPTIVDNKKTYTRGINQTDHSNLAVGVTGNTGTVLKSFELDNTMQILSEADHANTYSRNLTWVNQARVLTFTFDTRHTVTLKYTASGAGAETTATKYVFDGESLGSELPTAADVQAPTGHNLFAWTDQNGNLYTANTPISGDVTLTPLFRKNTQGTTGGAVIAANDFTIHMNALNGGSLTADLAKQYASVQGVDKDGNTVPAANISVSDTSGIRDTTGNDYTVTFTLGSGADTVSVSIRVTVSDAKPVVTGKTAHTMTFEGEPNTQYQIKDKNGNVIDTVTTDTNGKGVAKKGLEKGESYTIENATYGKVTDTTSFVDAADIAKQFEPADTADNGKLRHSVNPNDGTQETASNTKVDVTVGPDGNYVTTLKENIDHTVEVPDNWGDVTVDLNGHQIKGDDADATNPAKPGLNFTQTSGVDAAKRPGTGLTVKDSSGNGKIVGGRGHDSAGNTDGGAGIGTATPTPNNASITVAGNATIEGGKGADGTAGGGTGGTGIAGAITPKVESGGKVNGGAGGDGSGNGNGGIGGSGISVDNDVTVNGGEVNGGAGGKGGDGTGTDSGGDGGDGGTGINGAPNKNITVESGSKVTGGNAGQGGNSSGTGGAGNGGDGGTGTKTEGTGSTTNKGEITGGSGGQGGNSSGSGDAGTGGNGGTGNNGSIDNNGSGNVTGGSGGDGGDSTGTGNGGGGGLGGNGQGTGNVTGNTAPASINGGKGGDGGDSTNGTGGDGGAGGTPGTNTGNGNGGNGGGGGDSTNGDGGKGGDGGDSTNGTGGDGGDGGNSGPNKNPGNGGNGGNGNGGNDNGDRGNNGSQTTAPTPTPTPTPTPGGGSSTPKPNPTPQEPTVADPVTTGVSGWLNHRDHVSFMQGFGDGRFGPNENLTRAQAAQLFYNLLLNRNVEITVSFLDVPADEWYAKAVNTLASIGVINGVGEGLFEPDRSITRAEFAAIATRFAKASTANKVTFPDVLLDAWYYNAVRTAVSYGWINGMDDGTFAPEASITRAQSATIVNRMLARSADRDFIGGSEELRQFDDVTVLDWFFYQVMEAANGHDHGYNKQGSEIWTGWK